MNSAQRRKQRKREEKLATGAHAADLVRQLEDYTKKQKLRWFRHKLDFIDANDPTSKNVRYGIVWMEYASARATLPLPSTTKHALNAAFRALPNFLEVEQRFDQELHQARVNARVGPAQRVDDWYTTTTALYFEKVADLSIPARFQRPKSSPWKKDVQWWVAVGAALGSVAEAGAAEEDAEEYDDDDGMGEGAATGDEMAGGSELETEEESGESMEVDIDETEDPVLGGDLAAVIAEIRALQV